MIFLERKLVEYLNNKFLDGDKINHDNFLNYVVEKKWPRINYLFWFKGDKFKRKIEDVLDDCIAYKYIDKNYKVTRQGRDFLTLPLGFVEEFLKRRKRSIVIILVAIIPSVVTYFLL